MAEALANMAMDARRSVQVRLTHESCPFERWSTVYAQAANDVGHWLQRDQHEHFSRSVSSSL